MHSSPTDLASVIVVIAGALVLGVLLSRAVNRYRSPGPPLRMLTGARSQQAALRLALAPVLHEFLPMLDRAGQEVRAIVLVPTLSGSNGEPMASEVEQVGGSTAFTVRLAHRIGSTVRQPDEVAGALAEDLLYRIGTPRQLRSYGKHGLRQLQLPPLNARSRQNPPAETALA